MTIAYVQAASNGYGAISNNATVTATLGSSPTTGNLLVACTYMQDTGSDLLNMAAGWTELTPRDGDVYVNGQGQPMTRRFYYRVVEAGDATTIATATNVSGSARNMGMQVGEYSGIGIPAFAGLSTLNTTAGSASSFAMPSQSPAAGVPVLMISWMQVCPNYNPTTPGGWTDRTTMNTGGIRETAYLSDQIQSSPSGSYGGTYTGAGGESAWDVTTFSVTTAPDVVTGSITANADLQATIAGSFAADSVLQKTLAASLTADAMLQKTSSGSVSADSSLLATLSSSISADAVLQSPNTSSLTADAILRKTFVGSIAADAVIRNTSASSLAADGVLRKTLASSITVDAVILSDTPELSITVDAVLKKVSSGSISASAQIAPAAEFISYVQGAQQQSTQVAAGNSCTATLSATPTPGNLLLACASIQTGGAGATNLPAVMVAGWTLIAQDLDTYDNAQAGGGTIREFYYRVVQAGDTVNIASAMTPEVGAVDRDMQIQVGEYAGLSTSPSITGVTTSNTLVGSSSSYAIPAQTPTAGLPVLMVCWMSLTPGYSPATPAGWTQRLHMAISSDPRYTTDLADQIVTNPSGSYTGTYTGAGGESAWNITSFSITIPFSQSTGGSISADAFIARNTGGTISVNAFIGSSSSTVTAEGNDCDGTAIVECFRVPAGGAVESKLYRQDPFQLNWILIATLGASFSFTDNWPPMNQTFSYRIDALDVDGNVLDSNQIDDVLLTCDEWFLSSDDVAPFVVKVDQPEWTKRLQQEDFMVLSQNYKSVQSGKLLGAVGKVEIALFASERIDTFSVIRNLVNSTRMTYLRSPFGDSFAVSLGSPVMTNGPVGAGSVTLPFTEVGGI